MKRKTPKEVIEEGGNPNVEHSYIKFPREGLIPTTRKSNEVSVESDSQIIKQNVLQRNGKKYLDLHTHPYSKSSPLNAFPSSGDLYKFYTDSRMKSMVIAQRDEDSGDVQGYTYIIKGKKGSPELQGSPNAPINYKKGFFSNFDLSKRKERKEKKLAWKRELEEADRDFYEKNEIFSKYEEAIIKNTSGAYQELENMSRERDWKIRFVPAKGYYLSKETGNFEKNRGAGLEKAVASIIGISILLFSLFNVVNINGFVINNTTNLRSINLVWVLITFLLGISFFVVRRLGKYLNKKN